MVLMTYMADLISFIMNLESTGLMDVLLPFLLIFTIIFATLQRVKILGSGKKNYNVIVSIVMALSVVIPHVLRRYPPCWDVVEIINSSLPKIGLLVVAMITFLIIIGVVGNKINLSNKLMGGIGAFALAFVVYTFLTSRGPGCQIYLNLWFIGPDILGTIIAIAIFILLLWFITRDGGNNGSGGDEYPTMYE